MEKIFKTILFVAAGLFVLYVSLQSLTTSQTVEGKLSNAALLVATPVISIAKAPAADINELPFQDNAEIYQYDDPTSVVVLYVTVRKGNPSDNSDHTWREVNDFTKYYYINNEIVTVGKADAIVQFGDETGPLPGEVGYGAVAPNATIQIRGSTTSLSPQKSYKIELLSSAGEWRGQSTLDLNKHVFDNTRARNKLNFDLVKDIPNMVSLRTQFVHLYVKDETTNPWETAFVDYGLFTQIEQPNRKFLRAHLLDRDAQLYKANAFEFYRYPDEIRLVDDPLYDENAFFPILEVKGNQDHSKLIQMLDDLNNYDLPIEQTFDKYFDSENYFTWLAYNILVGNVDTQNQNFYLYSPKNGTKWYFIPWDYDGSFPLQNRTELGKFQYAPWENGVSDYWGSVLHNRVLRVEKYRRGLDDKINALMDFLTPERIKNMLDLYKKVTDPFVSRMPDLYYLDSTLKIRDQEFELLPGDIQANYDMYVASLRKPMPFYLGTPAVVNGKLNFNWDESFDFGAQDITYDFGISRDWAFSDIVYETKLTNKTEVAVDLLKPGTYFWRVTVVNTSGESQVSFNFYVDANSSNHYGMKYLYITPDGQVLEK